jgi:uncharacterized OB-fold protein
MWRAGDKVNESKKTRLISDKLFAQTPEGYVLVGSKCKSCGKVFFPKKTLCTACFTKDNMEVVPLSKKGRLVSHASDDRDMMGLGYPHICAYVDLPEGIRLFSLLTDVDDDTKLKEGLEVETVVERFRTDELGYDILVFKFRPCL